MYNKVYFQKSKHDLQPILTCHAPNKIESPHEIIGKILQPINSANSMIFGTLKKCKIHTS